LYQYQVDAQITNLLEHDWTSYMVGSKGQYISTTCYYSCHFLEPILSRFYYRTKLFPLSILWRIFRIHNHFKIKKTGELLTWVIYPLHQERVTHRELMKEEPSLRVPSFF